MCDRWDILDEISFRVLVLEIISGKKSREFRRPDHDVSLLGHVCVMLPVPSYSSMSMVRILHLAGLEVVAWRQKPSSYQQTREDGKPILLQIGLLWVQRQPEDRPTILSVIPKEPGFLFREESKPHG